MTRPMNVIELKEQNKQFEKDIRKDEQNKVFDKILKLKKYREQPNGSMYIFVEDIEGLRSGGEP